ncbi:MAG: 50S ribosomal protein L10 [Candidatus Bathyarchaeia archaeon]
MSAKMTKQEEVAKTVELLKEYPTVAVASLEKVRAAQLQELRRRFRGQMVLKALKNSLAKRAFEKAGEGMDKLGEHLTGQNMLLFAKENPFKLVRLLEQSKVKTPAKAGDIAPADIIVPSGNTGLPPGPVISEFTDVGIQTRIESGSVWVVKDTVVAKRGETISPKVAAVLSRLGIKPIEAGLTVKAAYSERLVLSQEQLKLDLDGVKASFQRGYSTALSLAINAGYATPETVPHLLVKAFREAYTVGLQAAYPSPHLIRDLLLYAQLRAQALNALVEGPRGPQP